MINYTLEYTYVYSKIDQSMILVKGNMIKSEKFKDMNRSY